jgi:hypothetical protein
LALQVTSSVIDLQRELFEQWFTFNGTSVG